MDNTDIKVRLRAFDYLADLEARYGEVLPRAALARGFVLEGQRVPLMGPQGIFKPAALSLPLSITTVPLVEGKPRPYEDEFDASGMILYRYRGTDPEHRDNVGLRQAMQSKVPLIYFFGVVAGQYIAVWPSFIIADDPGSLCFTVAIGEKPVSREKYPDVVNIAEAQRSYTTIEVKRRLHQQSFRYRVIRAYRQCCAVCRLRHGELLDAAHILPDSHPRGAPWVSNGLSLCKLHHAAFDSNLLGIRPDLTVQIRSDVMDESDGPMLVHGLQECHNRRLVVVPSSPKLRPNREFLEERYELFRNAG